MRLVLLPLIALVALAASGRPDGATIANSGSTNTPAWSVAIRSDGSATYVGASIHGIATNAWPTTRATTLPNDLVARFFTDVAIARTVSAQPAVCMKSASFGTSTNVRWHGWQSPDLSCPQHDARLNALAQDVRSIVAASAPVRRIPLPREPRRVPIEPMPASSPSPTPT